MDCAGSSMFADGVQDQAPKTNKITAQEINARVWQPASRQ